MKTHHIKSDRLSFENIKKIIAGNYNLALSSDAKEKVVKCRNYLDNKIASHKEPIYGVTTGFGSLYDQTISDKDLETLQKNLVVSHTCGTGDEVPQEIVKLMLLLKIQALSYGNSGVQLQTVERLIDFYNNNILPVIYQQGSLGASGDLAPLAHLALPLLGLGEVYFEGRRSTAENIHKKLKWKPVRLMSKEGLALINGTQFMGAYGIFCLLNSFRLSRLADIISAVSLDAFDGRIEPFDELITNVRPHKGQLRTAKNITRFLEGSELLKRKKEHVQDPYSFRCIPQVHGASKDAIQHVASVFLTEINSVSDNPLIFPDKDRVISGGNFHGQPLALTLDYLCIALAELGSISERRIYKLNSGQRALPSYLIANPGLNSGFMTTQYTAASIVSQNKQLCTPASVDTIDSSQGQEDHVSMGANAATKAYRVTENLETILAIELFNAAQALEFRRPAKSSPFIEKFISEYRKTVPFIDKDVMMHDMIEASIGFLKDITVK